LKGFLVPFLIIITTIDCRSEIIGPRGVKLSGCTFATE
jgi:hypothetical protein